MWKIVNLVHASVSRTGDAGELGLIRSRKEFCRLAALPRTLIRMLGVPGSSSTNCGVCSNKQLSTQLLEVYRRGCLPRRPSCGEHDRYITTFCLKPEERQID